MPRAAGRGRLSCLRRTATSAVRMASAGLADAPFVSAFAPLGKGLRTGSRLRERGEPLLCFRADGGRHWDYAGDVRRAVKVKRGGVLPGDLARLVATERQCADYERQKGN